MHLFQLTTAELPIVVNVAILNRLDRVLFQIGLVQLAEIAPGAVCILHPLDISGPMMNGAKMPSVLLAAFLCRFRRLLRAN